MKSKTFLGLHSTLYEKNYHDILMLKLLICKYDSNIFPNIFFSLTWDIIEIKANSRIDLEFRNLTLYLALKSIYLFLKTRLLKS